MRSTYLEHMEENLLAQMREEQAETAYAYDYKITSLNRNRPEKGSLIRDALPGGIAGIAACWKMVSCNCNWASKCLAKTQR